MTLFKTLRGLNVPAQHQAPANALMSVLARYFGWSILAIVSTFLAWGTTTKVGGAFLMVIVSWVVLKTTGMTPTAHIWQYIWNHPEEAPAMLLEFLFG
jgi:hypothetical protein